MKKASLENLNKFSKKIVNAKEMSILKGGATQSNADGCGVEQATSMKDSSEPSGGCADIAIDGKIVSFIYY